MIKRLIVIMSVVMLVTIVAVCFATSFSDTYDTNTPLGSDDPSEADDRMREIKAAVQERENVDHYWPLTGTEVSDADTGEHRKVTLRVGSAPTAVADKGFVYSKDVSAKAELFYRDEDGDEVQITSDGGYAAGAVDGNFTVSGDLAATGTLEATGLTTVADGSVTKTDAAPTTDTMLVNKKYVDDTVPTTFWNEASDVLLNDAATGGVASTFADLDTGIGAAAFCTFKVVNSTPGGQGIIKMRTKGDTTSYTAFSSQTDGNSSSNVFNSAATNQTTYLMMPCDSNGFVQIASDNVAAAKYTITLTGYVK